MDTPRPSLSRRPSALALVLGRTSLSSSPKGSVAMTSGPSSPLSTPPSTPPLLNQGQFLPPGLGRRRLLRRKSSLSSVSSLGSVGADDEDELAWTEQETEQLNRTVDNYLLAASLTESPFHGLPPSNLTHVIARAVVTGAATSPTEEKRHARSRRGSNASEKATWRHGIKATRAKILALVKEKQQTVIEATPRASDPDATPKRPRVPLVRQGSMDFLPQQRNPALVARLGNRLHTNTAMPKDAPPPSASTFSRTYSDMGTAPRLHRTFSLSSIAGSPTQPSTMTAKTPASATRPAFPSAWKMQRVHSEHLGSSSHSPASSAFSGLSAAPAVPGLKRGLGEGLGSAFTSPAIVEEDALGGGKKSKRSHQFPPSTIFGGAALGSDRVTPRKDHERLAAPVELLGTSVNTLSTSSSFSSLASDDSTFTKKRSHASSVSSFSLSISDSFEVDKDDHEEDVGEGEEEDQDDDAPFDLLSFPIPGGSFDFDASVAMDVSTPAEDSNEPRVDDYFAAGKRASLIRKRQSLAAMGGSESAWKWD